MVEIMYSSSLKKAICTNQKKKRKIQRQTTESSLHVGGARTGLRYILKYSREGGSAGKSSKPQTDGTCAPGRKVGSFSFIPRVHRSSCLLIAVAELAILAGYVGVEPGEGLVR